MFVFGVGKYSIRNKIFFIYPGMKHPKATKVEYIFAVVGFSLLTVCMAISGSLGVWLNNLAVMASTKMYYEVRPVLVNRDV